MLVVTRKTRESVIVGDGAVKFTILEVNGRSVRVGITADQSIPVYREEVFEAIKQGKTKGESCSIIQTAS